MREKVKKIAGDTCQSIVEMGFEREGKFQSKSSIPERNRAWDSQLTLTEKSYFPATLWRTMRMSSGNQIQISEIDESSFLPATFCSSGEGENGGRSRQSEIGDQQSVISFLEH